MTTRGAVPVTLIGGPAAGVMNLWPENIADEMFLPDREHAKANPDSPALWHHYRRSKVDTYVFVRTEEA